MSTRKQAEPVAGARRPCFHRHVREVAADVGGELTDRAVAIVTFDGHGLADDPVEIAAQLPDHIGDLRTAPLGRFGRLVPGQGRESLRRSLRVSGTDPRDQGDQARITAFERHATGQQFVQENAERVDVGARVDATVDALRVEGLGAHVHRRAENLRAGFEGEPGFRTVQRLGDAEIDDFRNRLAAFLDDQHVRRLQIPMQDLLPVRMLDAGTDPQEQLQSLDDGQAMVVAVGRDRRTGHEFHDEVRLAVLGRAGIEEARYVRVAEPGQRALFDSETLARVGRKIGADALECHFAPDRLLLARSIHLAHAARTESLDDRVRTDAGRQRQFRFTLLTGIRRIGKQAQIDHGGTVEEVTKVILRYEQGQHFRGQCVVVAGPRHDPVTAGFDRDLERFDQQVMRAALELQVGGVRLARQCLVRCSTAMGTVRWLGAQRSDDPARTSRGSPVRQRNAANEDRGTRLA